MLRRLFYLHIVKSTLCDQSCKRFGFLIFTLTFTSHFTFLWVLICSVNSIVKMTFSHLMDAMNSRGIIFKRDFIKTSYKYAKIIFSSVWYLYSLNIDLYIYIFNTACRVIVINYCLIVYRNQSRIFIAYLYFLI